MTYNPIAVFDFIFFLVSLVGLMILLIGYKKALTRGTKLLLSGLQVFIIAYSLCLAVEWSGITTALDTLEDFIGALIPMWWAFVFYSFNQEINYNDLQVSEEKFRALIESTNNWIWEVNKEGVYTYASPQVEEILGYKPEEVIGKTPFDLMPKEEAVRIAENFKDYVEKGEPIVTLENVNLHKNGQHVVLETSGVPFFDKAGKVTGYRGVDRDITTRKQFLKALSAKNKELQSVVYVASHDLRTPLVNIQGFAGELTKSCKEISELLKGEDTDETLKRKAAPLLDEDIPECLKFINTSVDMMSRLLDGLLRISRIGSVEIKTETIEMNGLVKNVHHSLEFQIQQSGATVNIEKLPGCYGDVGLLNQVFSNLLDNAIKYLDNNRKGKITISGRVEDDKSIYCVEDNGIGIDHKHQEKIFRIFHRLKPGGKVNGEGLGLSAVWRILSRLDGAILVESEPGKGSRFLVTLPNA